MVKTLKVKLYWFLQLSKIMLDRLRIKKLFTYTYCSLSKKILFFSKKFYDHIFVPHQLSRPGGKSPFLPPPPLKAQMGLQSKIFASKNKKNLKQGWPDFFASDRIRMINRSADYKIKVGECFIHFQKKKKSELCVFFFFFFFVWPCLAYIIIFNVPMLQLLIQLVRQII